MKARVGSEGGVFTPQTPEQSGAFLSMALQKNAKTIRDAGLKRDWPDPYWRAGCSRFAHTSIFFTSALPCLVPTFL